MEKARIKYTDKDSIGEDLTCPICYDPLFQPVEHQGNCKRLFCYGCLKHDHNNKHICPICQEQLDINQIVPVTIRFIVDKLNKLKVQCLTCKNQLLAEEVIEHQNQCSPLSDRELIIDLRNKLTQLTVEVSELKIKLLNKEKMQSNEEKVKSNKEKVESSNKIIFKNRLSNTEENKSLKKKNSLDPEVEFWEYTKFKKRYAIQVKRLTENCISLKRYYPKKDRREYMYHRNSEHFDSYSDETGRIIDFEQKYWCDKPEDDTITTISQVTKEDLDEN